MGCGCKDPQEGLTIQNKDSEWPEAVWPDGAMDEFQSKINSLQSEKNIWKASYEDLNAQVTAITTKLDALLDTLPENVQQQFNEAFSEAPVASPATAKITDHIFRFAIELYVEAPENYDNCDFLDGIDIQVRPESRLNVLQIRTGDAEIEPTNLDDLRQQILDNYELQKQALDAEKDLF
jgi:hypothetical protein